MPDLFGKLKSGAGKVAFEADKMARLNRVQGEQGQLKRQIEGLYAKLGEMYYHKYVGQETESPAFVEVCQQIADLERQVAAKQEEAQKIQAGVYNPQVEGQPAPAAPVQAAPAPVNVAPVQEPAAPVAQRQTKFCPNCGHEMPLNVNFCPECGTKVG